ncbi:MAG: 30S ribosomal protein S9 [bacterium]
METGVVAVGRRKRAVANVRIRPGSGRITVNGREFHQYFPVDLLQSHALAPLSKAPSIRDVDIFITARGGGITGQAGAVRLGLARSLLKIDPTLRGLLKKEGYLTRDPREKERKKYGLRRARKAFQYSKR